MHIELREIQDNNYEKINLIKVLSKKKQKKREAQIKPIVYKRKILVGYPNNYKAPSILIAFLFQNFSHVQKGEWMPIIIELAACHSWTRRVKLWLR